jgi:hypothetical protein
MAADLIKFCIKCGEKVILDLNLNLDPSIEIYCKKCIDNLKSTKSKKWFIIEHDICSCCERKCNGRDDFYNFRYCKHKDCKCWYCEDCECCH